jgi:hypothetical protein
MQRREMLKGFAAALCGLAIAGCLTVDTGTVQPLPIHSAVSGNYTMEKIGRAIDTSATRYFRIVDTKADSRVIECDYQRCQIRFTATVTFNEKGYDITFKELQNAGRGRDYTFNYYNRVMKKLDTTIQRNLVTLP